MNYLKPFDLTDIDSAPRMLERMQELEATHAAAKSALWTALNPEQTKLVRALLNAQSEREMLSGARLTLVAFRKAHNREATAALHQESPRLREANARIKVLEQQLEAARRASLTAMLPPPPLPEPTPPAAPDWDYPQQKERRRRRDEVITHSPFSVEVVARQVEETVKQFGGRCMKPDVSARLPPEARPHLPAAYKHLHASRRVRVDGWNLSIWTR